MLGGNKGIWGGLGGTGVQGQEASKKEARYNLERDLFTKLNQKVEEKREKRMTDQLLTVFRRKDFGTTLRLVCACVLPSSTSSSPQRESSSTIKAKHTN